MTEVEKLKQRLADLSDEIVRAEARATELRFMPPSPGRDELIVLNEQTLVRLTQNRSQLLILLADESH